MDSYLLVHRCYLALVTSELGATAHQGRGGSAGQKGLEALLLHEGGSALDPLLPASLGLRLLEAWAATHEEESAHPLGVEQGKMERGETPEGEPAQHGRQL